MPSAPDGETADGFQPDSASICAARSGAEIPRHSEPASSRTGIRAGIGTADVARTAVVDGLLAPLAATATSPTTPKTRAQSAPPITVIVVVGKIRPFEVSSHEELGRETTLVTRNLESLAKCLQNRGPWPSSFYEPSSETYARRTDDRHPDRCHYPSVSADGRLPLRRGARGATLEKPSSFGEGRTVATPGPPRTDRPGGDRPT